jgi:hypothetical protein
MGDDSSGKGEQCGLAFRFRFRFTGRGNRRCKALVPPLENTARVSTPQDPTIPRSHSDTPHAFVLLDARAEHSCAHPCFRQWLRGGHVQASGRVSPAYGQLS